MDGILTLDLCREVVGRTKATDVAMAMLGLFLFSAVVQRVRSKGPMLWPVLGIIPTVFFHIHEIYDWATDALISCGGTFPYRGMWLGGARGLITLDPSNVEYMLKTRFKNFPKGKYYRERFHDLLGDGIFNSDDEVWKLQRRAAMSEMHSTRFVEFSAKTTKDLVQHKLLKLIENVAERRERIDLQEVLLRFTFDNICAAAFGVDTGCLEVDLPEVPFARAFEKATELTLLRFLVPPIVWKPMKIFGLGSEESLREAVRVVHCFAEQCVLDRRTGCQKFGGLSDRFDLLSRLMVAQECQFSNKFLKDFCISFILAGRDTSSVALTWFFWLIHKHPEVENQILAEIEKVVDPSKEEIFSLDELKKMEYLQAAISEALRLYPSVPIDFKEAVEDDVFPDGKVVNKGDRVIYSMFSMARAEAVWGEDCREFKPERWMKEGKFASENQFKYPVFNAGSRLCIGKKFAYMQMKMVAASVLVRYSVSVVEGHVVLPKLNTTLYMKNGLQVTFNPRLGFKKIM